MFLIQVSSFSVIIPRLLLRKAMQCSQAPYEIHGVNPDHWPAGKFSQDAQRDSVVRIVEGRNEDGGVTDIEVRIARGKAPTLEVNRGRHGQRDHFGLRSIFKPEVLNALPVLVRRHGPVRRGSTQARRRPVGGGGRPRPPLAGGTGPSRPLGRPRAPIAAAATEAGPGVHGRPRAAWRLLRRGAGPTGGLLVNRLGW